MPSPLRVVSWNIGRRVEPWQVLSAGDFDIALLQEATPPPPEVESVVETDPGPWRTEGQPDSRPWRAAVARLSDRVRLLPREMASLSEASGDVLPVSRMGTLAVADIEVVETGERLTVASVYGLWEGPVDAAESNWIYADASAHRVLSDLSALIGRQDPPPLLVAGDLNILFGYGEHGSPYWKERYQTVFDRAQALGLRMVGPQGPAGGQPASPRPAEFPADSANVPTYRTRAADPATATRQLDFVFASNSVAERTRVRALNSDAAWGPSDHCRIAIEVDPVG